MDFDFVSFLNAGVNNAPMVIAAVMALTFLAGRFGLKGKAQLGFALGLGSLAGSGLQIAELGVPQTFAAWYWLVIYAVVMAATPSLLYDNGKDLMTKVIADVMGQVGVQFVDEGDE